jgi:hypothetical protein
MQNESMEVFYDLLKITIPAAIVGYLAYLLVRSFLQSKLEEVSFVMRQKNQETVIPIRLQAYERICLLLERINPSNLVQRLNNGEYSAAEFQQILVHEIREEFNHNLSQQVYMSSEAWTYVTTSVEQVISEVNGASNGLEDDSTSIDLAKALLELQSQKEVHILTESLDFVKKEIQVLF